LSPADWQKYHDQFDAAIVKAVTPDAAVAARRTPQSTNPAAVATALAECRAWAGRWLAGAR
jgi:argininosuccinate lyase